MAFGSDPNPSTPSPEPVSNTRREEEREGHHHHHPSSLTAFASPEAEWDAADATDEDEWAAASAAAAAELEDEAKWEDAAPAESEDDVPAAESEDEAGTGEPDSPPRWWPSTSARRDPRKIELFRRLDAACEDRRLQEARRRKSPPPPTCAGDPDEPIWPPKSPHWRRFRELSATKSSPANPLLNPDENSLSPPPSNKSKEMLYDKECETFAITSNRELSATKSSPANPVLNPDENSLSLPPSNKSKEMLYDKAVDQGDDTASSQIVPYENGHEEKPLPVPSKKIKPSIDTYAVQCGECWKWRLIPTKKIYDEIREKCSQVRFLCKHAQGWKPGVSCDDPADISQDDGFWVIDRPCIAQTPLGWERKISIRSEGPGNFADVYYFPPTGPKLRSFEELKRYLQENPDCTIDLQKYKKWFKIPERLQGYLKRCRRQSKPLQPNEVLPLSSAPPIHEDLAPNCVLALYDKGQYCM